MSRLRFRYFILTAATFVVLGFAPALTAQETIKPGDRVRITTKGPEGARTDEVIGDLDRITTDQLFLSSDGNSVTIDKSDVVAAAVSVGEKSNWQKGLLWGVVIGGLGGVIYGIADDSTDVIGPMAIGAVGGGVVGLGIGALIKSEQWVGVPLQSGLSLGIRQRSFALLIPTRF